MKGAIAVIAITILMAGTSLAQVHIKESATITPKQVKNVQGEISNNHTITFELHWDGTQYGMVDWEARWDQTLGSCPVDYTVDQSIDHFTLTLLSPPAQFYSLWANLGVQHISADTVVEAHYHWNVYCDNTLIGSDAGIKYLCCWGYGDTPWRRCGGVDFLTPYFANFSFSLSSHQLQSGGSAGMSLKGMYNEDYNVDCNSTWSPTDPLKLAITSGSQYASFHGPDPQTGTETNLGNVVMTTGDQVGQYFLVADGAAADSDNCWATVEAQSDGIVRTDYVQVLSSVDHFYVHAEPDTIEDSAQTTVIVQAKNKSDQDMGYEGTVQISTSPSGYGHLDYWLPGVVANPKDKSNGRRTMSMSTSSAKLPNAAQTVKSTRNKSTTTADSVLETWYGNIAGGQLFYVADGNVPDNNTMITFTVTAVDNPSLTGTGSVVIRGNENGCAVLSLSASSMMAGDTAIITIAKKLEDGTIIAYPDGTEFNLNLTKGADYGILVGSGGSGSSMTTTSPAKFIAKNDIDVGPFDVTIHAEVSSGSTAKMLKKPGAKPMIETCEPPEASATVKGYPDCGSVPPLNLNIVPSRMDNNPHCSTISENGSVEGGNTYPEWPAPGDEKMSITVCQDKSTGQLRENLYDFQLYIIYGVCTNNLPGQVITDLSSIPDNKVQEVINDLMAQKNTLENTTDPINGKYSLFDSYITHEGSHVPTVLKYLSELAKQEREKKMDEPISRDLAKEIMTDDNVYHREVFKIRSEMEGKTRDDLKLIYDNGDEYKARITQAKVLESAINQLESRSR